MCYFNLFTIIAFYLFLCKYDPFFSHSSIYFNLKNTPTIKHKRTLSKYTAIKYTGLGTS